MAKEEKANQPFLTLELSDATLSIWRDYKFEPDTLGMPCDRMVIKYKRPSPEDDVIIIRDGAKLLVKRLTFEMPISSSGVGCKIADVDAVNEVRLLAIYGMFEAKP